MARQLKSKGISFENEMEDLISLLSKMVSIQTESPAGRGYEELVKFIESWVRSRLSQYDVEIVEVPRESYSGFPDLAAKFDGPRLNLLLKARNRKAKTVHVNGHFDVVMAGEPERWIVTKPFEPVSKEGRLYGRGTSDMKGSIACLLKALEIVQKNGLDPKFN